MKSNSMAGEQRKMRNMLQEVSQNLAKRKIEAVHKTISKRGCWLPKSISKNTDGYAQLKFTPDLLHPGATGKASQKTYLLHKLAMLSAGTLPEGTQHTSHLCDVRECFNAQHLTAESPQEKNSRKGCPGDVTCGDCQQLSYSCPHNPKCIR